MFTVYGIHNQRFSQSKKGAKISKRLSTCDFWKVFYRQKLTLYLLIFHNHKFLVQGNNYQIDDDDFVQINKLQA